MSPAPDQPELQAASVGMHWVHGELEQNLQLATKLIEQYAEARKKQSDLLYKAEAYLQEVRGVAILVRAFGLALLAEEMRQTLRDIIAEKIRELDPAYSALGSACVQAVDYLDLLRVEGNDSALILQPVVNELRLARGLGLLTEDDLFVAQFRVLSLKVRHTPPASPQKRLKEEAARLSPAFSASLLAWFKEQDASQAMSRIGRISELLAASSVHVDMHQLWRTAAACIEALLSDALEPSLEVKRQFGRAGQLIKIIAAEGEVAAIQKMSDVSLRLLFSVGRSQGRGPRTSSLREELQLDRWVPRVEQVEAARGRLRGANTDLLEKVVEELRSDLSEVRVSIDLAMRSGASPDEYENTAKRLKGVADTLMVLGLSAESEALAEPLAALGKGAEAGADVWEHCATSLLQVDLSLEAALYRQLQAGPAAASNTASKAPSAAASMAAADLRSGRLAVLRESLVDIARTKANIDAFLKAGDRSGLADTARLLYEVGAGLRMLDMESAEQSVGLICEYLQGEAIADIAQDPGRANIFADAIAALEYFLEFVRDESPGQEQARIQLSQRAQALSTETVADSGLGSDETSPVEPATEPSSPKQTEEVPELQIEDQVSSQAVSEAQDPVDAPASAEAEPEAFSLELVDYVAPEDVSEEPPAPSEKPEYDPLHGAPAGVGSELELQDDADTAAADDDAPADDSVAAGSAGRDEVIELSGDSLPEPETDETPEQVVSVSPDDADDGSAAGTDAPAEPEAGMDPEIREIFIDEAGEVLETIQAALPGWQRQSDDRAMMTTIRRGFHTLKGSGRMVGAHDFGEFAWEIENLLNRCLDQTLEVKPAVMRTVEEAIGLIPAMIEAFKTSGETPPEARLLAERARSLASPESDDAEEELEAVFRTDALARLQMVLRWIGDQSAEADEHSIPDPVVRAFHTLRGAAMAIGAESIGQVCGAIEDYLDDLIRDHALLGREGLAALDECGTTLNLWISRFENADAEQPDAQALLDRIGGLHKAIQSQDEDEDDEDRQMAEVFAFEALDLVQKFETDANAWANANGKTQYARALKSTIHTLKGAAAMAGCAPIAAVAQALNLRLGDMLDSGKPEAGFFETLNRIIENLYSLLDDFRAGKLQGDGMEWVEQVAALDNFAPDPDSASETSDQPLDFAESMSAQDAETLYLFLSEVGPLMETLESNATVIAERPDDRFVAGEWLRALHTVKGSARMAGFTDIGELAHRLEAASESAASSDGNRELFARQVANGIDGLHQLIDEARAHRSGAAGEVLAGFDALVPEAVEEAEDVVLEGLEPVSDISALQDEAEVSSDQTQDSQLTPEAELEQEAEIESEPASEAELDVPVPDSVLETLSPETESDIDDADPDLIEIFEPEAEELFESLSSALADWQDDPAQTGPVAEMQRHLHTFKGGARMTGLNRLGNAAHRLETQLVALETSEQPVTAADLSQVTGGLNLLRQLYSERLQPKPPAQPAQAPLAEVQERAAQDASAEQGANPDTPDPELIEIFVPEAQELLESLQSALSDWQQTPDHLQHAGLMQRDLHTFKGGARMSGLRRLGDAAHALETQLVALGRDASLVDAESLRVISKELDELQQLYESSRKPAPAAAPTQPSPGSSPEDKVKSSSASTPAEQVPTPSSCSAVEVASSTPDELPQVWDQNLFWRPEGEAATPSELRREAVRVPVERLDAMLNQAGEISIFHSRLEENHATFGTTLGEMEQTITRIREQLRMMEVETEAQIAARGFARGASDADDRYESEFDALEMDRYSRMQELSRALAESVSDLGSLHNTLDHSGTEAEALLQQQGRINNEVQQGLMGTLMVPFSRQVQRLSRVVRQTAEQNGKAARAEFSGADSELDRNVLERMTAPLEHLLRNCVVHGIEEPAQRKKAGKSESGIVNISLKREGSQLLIEVQDDGRGLDFKSIRAQAVKRGLMREDAEVTDEDLARFVFAPGFSTAKALTQDAGRGIGMDVVAAEVKQLGGTVDLSSQTGRGARFSIRLPLMLAVSQALVVQVAEEFFAIPIASVEGITRAPREALEEMMQDEGRTLEYAGNHYQVRRLAELVGLPAVTRKDLRSVPAILMRLGSAVGGAERRVAVVADRLIGNREVVSKAAGPVLGSVAGISGATLMADGQVMLILDVPALIQEAVRRRLGDEAAATQAVVEDAPPMIMVVDDSITIRRVTERLLSRKGYRVVTARDGVDAMATLQTETPDAVLLDIEMPRADGFEVAAFIRNTPRLADMPILMITSRSGDKHREHARQIGVDKYLIKPFQEEQLLSELREVLTASEERNA